MKGEGEVVVVGRQCGWELQEEEGEGELHHHHHHCGQGEEVVEVERCLESLQLRVSREEEEELLELLTVSKGEGEGEGEEGPMMRRVSLRDDLAVVGEQPVQLALLVGEELQVQMEPYSSVSILAQEEEGAFCERQ